ncbi:helix-turn-helix domain-containing protein [Brevibacillus massiliensis]|uniref:helix-turn-helix domain-containing protein n=1 Tax=Brevibacillus massiliensis TaxID=1118054 RepID=UPI0002E104AA|nr:helix-turn-helix domain-containing protein [Brevibacillus massiliensis]
MSQFLEKEEHFMKAVALYGLARLAGERTLYALYYVLKGRKANQTIQDVHLFGLHSYYRLFPDLLRERWTEILSFFLAEKWIAETTLSAHTPKKTYSLTERGRQALAEAIACYELDKWLGFDAELADWDQLESFWYKLHLIVQTTSHLLRGKLDFYPVVQKRQVQKWVRRQLQTPQQRQLWMEGLYRELHATLGEFPSELQRLIVSQFSGMGQAGLTLEQIAHKEQEALSFIRLKQRYALTCLYLKALRGRPGETSLLASLCEEQAAASERMTQSARETLRLLRCGISPEEIAGLRGLKVATVEDHLVEIALHQREWDPSRYLSAAEQARIIEASRALGTRRLRAIKDYLGPEYSYLKIRLALAKKEGASWG